MADHTDECPMYRMRFLDGTPVPDDYYRQVSKLVRDAADGDPGEIDEAIDSVLKSEGWRILPKHRKAILGRLGEL